MGTLRPVLETVKRGLHVWYHQLYLRVGMYACDLIWGRLLPV